LETKWGRLFQSYGDGSVVMPGVQASTAAIAGAALGAALVSGGYLASRRRRASG